MLRELFWPKDKVSPEVKAKANELHRMANRMRQEAWRRGDKSEPCDDCYFYQHWKEKDE